MWVCECACVLGESHIVFVHCFCSLLYTPLTQILGIAVHYNKFYSILFYSILIVWAYDFYDMTLSTGKQRRHMINNCIGNNTEYEYGNMLCLFVFIILCCFCCTY